MTELEEARQLLATHFPHAPLAWFGAEAQGERRVDAFLAGEAGETSPFYVMSLRIDGSFVADAVSEYPHLPFDTALFNAKPPRSRAPGVFVTSWPVHSLAATQARFTHRGALRVAVVRAGHCALFDWNTGWLAADHPRPTALLIDGVWQPTISPLVAATAEDFRRAYVAHANNWRPGGNWASDVFFDISTFADGLRMIECILESEDLSPQGAGFLAAGPVENLIGTELLDHIEGSAAARARWVPLLHGTYWSSEPPHVRRRLRKLLGLSPEPE